jgi:hypothetical protein
MNTRLSAIISISRIALGLVWFYEGLVPKILFVRTDEIGLVQASHLVWQTPELTQSRQTESGLSRGRFIGCELRDHFPDSANV